MYHSPIPLTGLQPQFSGPELFKYGLPLARKKMLAEFQLVDADTIQVDGKELNRQEVISLFDELADDQRLQFHMAIWQDPVLLQFLQTGELQHHQRFAANELYETPEFRQFVSPWFAQAQNRLLKYLLAGTAAPDALEALAANSSLMTPADREEAFHSASRFFSERKSELLNIYVRAQQQHAVQREEIEDSLGTQEIFVLNHLPDDFENTRYELANLLNNICVEYDKQSAPKMALAAIEKAASIALHDEVLKDLIPRNLDLVRSKQPGVFRPAANPNRGGGNSGGTAWWSIVVVVVVLIRLIISLSRCDSSDRNNMYPVINYGEQSNIEMGKVGGDEATANYIAIVKSMQQLDSVHSEGTPLFHEGHKPRSASDEVYDVSGYDGYTLEQSALSESAKGGKKQVLISNGSSWDLVAWYLLDDLEMHNVYVPPHDSLLLEYTSDNVRMDLVAGKKWSDRPDHFVSLYYNKYKKEEYNLKGGYTLLPDNRRKYCNPDYLPLYGRNGVRNYEYNDRIVLRDSSGNNLSVRKFMDKGRELP